MVLLRPCAISLIMIIRAGWTNLAFVELYVPYTLLYIGQFVSGLAMVGEYSRERQKFPGKVMDKCSKRY